MLKQFPKIAIIIPYFGKWPVYLNFFLRGCENNAWLSVLLFTDCEPPKVLPSNVNLIPFDLNEFSKLASEKLKENFNLKKAYKICDFRPCFGVIFEDYLATYDYWGYGDIDLIYGDLEPFIFPKVNQGFDVISNREEIISGSLSMFRNISQVNLLFNKSVDFRRLLQSEKYEGLDETAFDNSTWQGAIKSTLPPYSFTYLLFKEHEENSIKVSFSSTCQEFIGAGDVVNFNSNKLTFNGTPISYYHYVCNKNKDEFRFPRWSTVPAQFLVTETGFYRNSTRFHHQIIHLERKTTGFILDKAKRILKRLKIWS